MFQVIDRIAVYQAFRPGLSRSDDNWPATANLAPNQAAEREGYHHTGGRPRPDQPVRRILVCVSARSNPRSGLQITGARREMRKSRFDLTSFLSVHETPTVEFGCSEFLRRFVQCETKL